MDIKEVYRKLYPLTIVMDRYTGTYSGGVFTAWELDVDEVPWEIAGGDLTASTLFDKIRDGRLNLVYGVGRTPDDAAMDLYLKLNKQRIKR